MAGMYRLASKSYAPPGLVPANECTGVFINCALYDCSVNLPSASKAHPVEFREAIGLLQALDGVPRLPGN
jgi:hypothetical protein